MQLPGASASYNDPQMEKAGMTQLSAVSGVSGASAVSGLSGSIPIDVPLQRLKIKKSPIQTANFGTLSSYAPPQLEPVEAIQPQRRQLPTQQAKPKRLQLQQRQIQTLGGGPPLGVRSGREGGLPKTSGRGAAASNAGTGGGASGEQPASAGFGTGPQRRAGGPMVDDYSANERLRAASPRDPGRPRANDPIMQIIPKQ